MRSASRPPRAPRDRRRSPPGARPALRKALGQHHLRHGAAARPLIDFLDPSGRTVVEIGCGDGALTHELLAAGARVLGVELDLAWAARLRDRERSPDLGLAVGDALDLDYRARRSDGAPFLWAGNLPYAIGTAVVERWLAAASPGARAAWLLQREVVDRLVAPPGSRTYGALSVLTQVRADLRMLSTLAPGAFRPPPKVESAFVGMVAVEPRVPGELWEPFRRTVRDAFAQRRKTLRNALAAAVGREAAERICATAGIEPERRAETLDAADFVALARARLEGGEAP